MHPLTHELQCEFKHFVLGAEVLLDCADGTAGTFSDCSDVCSCEAFVGDQFQQHVSDVSRSLGWVVCLGHCIELRIQMYSMLNAVSCERTEYEKCPTTRQLVELPM